MDDQEKSSLLRIENDRIPKLCQRAIFQIKVTLKINPNRSYEASRYK
jgi:hypothetical protein